jgi:hypothetical protein
VFKEHADVDGQVSAGALQGYCLGPWATQYGCPGHRRTGAHPGYAGTLATLCRHAVDPWRYRHLWFSPRTSPRNGDETAPSPSAAVARHLTATALMSFEDLPDQAGQPCRALHPGCFLLIRNTRPRRRTTIGRPWRRAIATHSSSSRSDPLSARGAGQRASRKSMCRPAIGSYLRSTKQVRVVAPALAGHVRVARARTADEPHDRAGICRASHGDLPSESHRA